MNVTCNKCGKKYVIGDDKVAGKTSVKIRCKQCQNLIAVNVGAQASADGGVSVGVSPTPQPAAPVPQEWESEATRTMPPIDPNAAWYAMIAGKQQGPFDVLTLQRKVGGGEVTLRTYLWKPGMGDWKRASDVPEVSPIFAGVSVGATATGQTQLPVSEQPSSKRVPAVARDVALANEVPSPEVTRPHVESKSAAAPGVQNGAAPAPIAEPAPAAKNTSAPLNDLFNDMGSSTSGLPPVTDHPATPLSDGSPPVDPFAQIGGPVKAGEAPPPGEATKFFIAKAGVNKRNPPWKIALFVVTGIGLPVALAWLATTLNIVQLPLVTHTNDDGTTTQESFFSPNGIAGLKDALTGEAARKKSLAEQKERDRLAAIANVRRPPPTAKDPKEPDEVVKPPKAQDPNLAALYANTDVPVVKPKIRKDPDSAAANVNAAGLSNDAAMKVINDKQKAFGQCVDTALHRNPKLAVGNILIVLTVGASGAVKSASVEPKKHEGADWAQCMVAAAKRITFPSSDGETQLEVPFKVGVALSP